MVSAAMVLNQIMGFLEIANLSGCAGYFMARNSRTIYRKKRWYVLGLALYTAVNGMGICFVKGMLVFPAVMLLAAALGAVPLALGQGDGAEIRQPLGPCSKAGHVGGIALGHKGKAKAQHTGAHKQHQQRGRQPPGAFGGI